MIDDRIDVDTDKLPGIVRSLGDRARDADGLLDDVKSIVNRVNALEQSCDVNLSLAWTYLDQAAAGLSALQREVAVRALAIAQSQCDSQLAEDIKDIFKPPEQDGGSNSGFMGWVHTALDGAGFIPGLGEIADGTNALIYLGQGDWQNAAISGIGMIPIGGQAATGARMVHRGIDLAKGLRPGARSADDLAEEVARFGRHADDLPFGSSTNFDEAFPGVREGVDDVPSPRTTRPQPGTDEHRAAAWERYKERGGQWDYERWKNSYEANIRNPGRSHQMMNEYRDALGWPHREVTVKTPHGDRRIDIAHADPAKRRGVEHKTGTQYRSPENLSEIERDKWLVEDGWNIVWVFEKSTPSKPLLDELRKAGIPWVIE